MHELENYIENITDVFSSEDPQGDLAELKRLMFKHSAWVRGCEILVSLSSEAKASDKSPAVFIRYKAGEEYAYLRHSKGPLQGYFWDIYGDDFQSMALATLALYKAPPPRNVDPLHFIVPRSEDEKA